VIRRPNNITHSDKAMKEKPKRSTSNKGTERSRSKKYLHAIYDKLQVLRSLIATKIKAKRLTVDGNITVVGTVDGIDIATRDALHNFSYHYVVSNFYSISTTTAFFVPLVGGFGEVATPGTSSGERFGMIAPYDGILSKVMFRSENPLRHDLLCELVYSDNDTELPATVRGTLNAGFVASSIVDDTTYTYDFTGILTSGANNFTKGQVLGIRLDPSGGSQGDCYCICVFKYDITT